MIEDVFVQQAGRLAGVGQWRLDLKTKAVQWSQQTLAIFEYAADDRPTMADVFGLFTVESRPILDDLIHQAISNGKPYDVELALLPHSGTLKWLRGLGEIDYENGQAIALTGAFQDISQQKADDVKMIESLEETRRFYDDAPCGYYSLGPDRTFLRVNDRILNWLGCTRGDIIGLKKPTDYMTPESLEPALVAFEALKRQGEFNGLECELRPVNGFSRHVSISATAKYDANGVFLYSSSVMYDISEMVNYRTKAENLTHDLLAMIDNDLVGIIMVRDRMIVWANKAMHQLFGYRADELVGSPTRIAYKDDASYAALGQAAYPVLKSGDVYKTEMEMQRKNGNAILINMNGVQLQNRDGDTMWIMADITELKRHNEQYLYIALHDSLTGLPNRRSFTEQAELALVVADRMGTRTAICYLDLDGFKAINDSFGHDAGDALLVTIAERLKKNVRKNDGVYRLGGDEFILLLNDLDDSEEIDRVLDRIIAEINQPIEVLSKQFSTVTGSIGLSLFPDNAREKGVLLRQADHALYLAKGAGKNRVVKFS